MRTHWASRLDRFQKSTLAPPRHMRQPLFHGPCVSVAQLQRLHLAALVDPPFFSTLRSILCVLHPGNSRYLHFSQMTTAIVLCREEVRVAEMEVRTTSEGWG